MGRHADFATVTREALRFALADCAPGVDEATVSDLCSAFDRLNLYPDAEEALAGLERYRLGILSNGTPAMLEALLLHAGCERRFEFVVSTDAAQVFKPHPAAYRALLDTTGLHPSETALVSSNGFDLAGAKSFGLRTVRNERMTPEHLRETLGDAETLSPFGMFSAQRSMADNFFGRRRCDLSIPARARAVAPSIATAALRA